MIENDCINLLSTNSKKWSNTLKQFVDCYRQIVFSVLDHFAELTSKDLKLVSN